MTPDRLRQLAAHHASVARHCLTIADTMGCCPTADQFRSDARRHSEWAEDLSQLADAFYAFAAQQ